MAVVNPIQVQKFLKGIDYPARKDQLLAKAMSLGADENIRETLEQLPDEEFQTPADVSQAIGHLEEEPGEAAAKERERKQEERRHTGTNEFLIEAMQDTIAEVQVCELALKKSAHPDVQSFAKMMIDEHKGLGIELEKLAKKKKLEVPREIRREQKMTVDELHSLSGSIFEQRWIQYNIDVHERDVKVFGHYAHEEPDPDIRKMAKHAGDMMGKHLKLAHEVGKKLAKA